MAGNTPTARATYFLALANMQSGRAARAKQLFEYITSSFPGSSEATLAQTALSRLSPTATKTPDTPKTIDAVKADKAESPDDPDAEADVKYKEELAKLPNKVDIRFNRSDNGHMMVDAYLNGRPIKCWFDTGANEYFGANQLREIGLPPPSGDPDTYTRGWAGKQVPIWRRTMTLKVGTLERTLPISISETADLLPLIGQGFVKDYQYAVDSNAGRMVLTKKTDVQESAKATLNSLYDIPCDVEDQREYVAITVNGKQCDGVLIDTGASSTILSAAAASRLGIDTSNGRRTRIVGVGGDVAMVQVYADVRLGPITKLDFPILVGGAGGSAIGQDFMTGWRFTVDREAKLLKFFH